MDEQVSSQSIGQNNSLTQQKIHQYVTNQCAELQKTGGIVTFSIHAESGNHTELITGSDNILYTIDKTNHPLVTAFITNVLESALANKPYCLGDSKSITGYSLTIHPYKQLQQEERTTTELPRLLSPYNEKTSFGVIITEQDTYKTDLGSFSYLNHSSNEDMLSHTKNKEKVYSKKPSNERVIELTFKQYPIMQSIAELCGVIEGLNLIAKTLPGRTKIQPEENLTDEEFISQTVPATRFQWILNALASRAKTIDKIADAAQTTAIYAKANIRILESVNIVEKTDSSHRNLNEYTLTDDFLKWRDKTKFDSVTEAQVNYILRKSRLNYKEQISNAYTALHTLPSH